MWMGWLVEGVVGYCIGGLMTCLVRLLVDRLIGRLLVWLVGCLACRVHD